MMVRKKKVSKRCPLCGGLLKRGTTTFTADLGFGVVVVRSVPARVCSQCGEDWIGSSEARLLEKITDEARRKRHQVEVMSLS